MPSLTVRKPRPRFRSDTAPAMLRTSDPDGACTLLSKAWRDFTGQTEAAGLGFGWMEAIHEEDRDQASAAFRAAYDKRAPFSLDYRLRRHDGEYRRAIDMGRPHYGPGGEFLGFLGSVVDVTDLKMAEMLIEDGERRFRELFNAVPVAVFVCDCTAVIQDYNERAAALWGRRPQRGDPRERYCGSLKLFLPDGEELPLDQSPIVSVLASGEPVQNVEVAILRPDGSRLPVMVNFTAMKNALGEVTGAITSFYDITPLKQSEQVLKDAARNKDEFLAMLSHELRNPLAPIRTAVQMMQMQGLDASKTQWALGVIDRQSGQMARLVEDLMDVSRISRNQLEVRKGRAELAEVLRIASETSRPLIEERQQRLTVSVPPGEIFLNADLARMAQALSNLLNNAAKYTDPGGRIDLLVERHGGDVLIKVRDTGIGIPASMLSQIFEMFAQVDRSLERAHGGLGIGLSLAQRLVVLHGGTLTVHSDGPGKGSEFTVRLPVMEASHTAKTAEAPSPSPAAPGPRRILLVDDNRLAALSMSMLLRAEKHEVRLAYDGEEAVNAAAEFRPEVVVMDLGLPKLSGNEAARKIRHAPEGKQMVLIALTGRDQESDKQNAREAGFDHYLVKPVDAGTLTGLLRSLDAPQAPGD